MALTVKELIAALRDVPPEALVVLQKDREGNDFSPLDGVDTDSVYEAVGSWSGLVLYARLTPELEAQGYTEEDVGGPSAVPCVVLWPVS